MDIEDFKQTYGKGWLDKYNTWKRAQDVIKSPPPKSDIKRKDGNRRKSSWTDFDYYRDDVRQLSEGNKHHLPNIHKRGFNTYHLDHKISIIWGYENGIPAENIAHQSNMEMIWWKDNVRKNVKCKIDDDNKWIVNQE